MAGELSERIAKRIVEARKSKGMTQYQVADKLGITPGRYLHYEKGRAEPSLDMIYRLCVLFNESFDEWLGLRQPSEKAGLSEQEIGFIRLYRQLSKEGRQAVDGIVRALLSAANQNTDLEMADDTGSRMGTAPGVYGLIHTGYAAFKGDGWNEVGINTPEQKQKVDEAFLQARAAKAEREADEAARNTEYFRRIGEIPEK